MYDIRVCLIVDAERRPFKQELAWLNRFRRGTTTDISSHNLLVDPESVHNQSDSIFASGILFTCTQGSRVGENCGSNV